LRRPHPPAVDLVGTAEVALEHQPAAACDQNGVHVCAARTRQSIGHAAQRSAVDQLVLGDGGDGPTVVPRQRNTAGVARFGIRRPRDERRQRRPAEK